MNIGDTPDLGDGVISALSLVLDTLICVVLQFYKVLMDVFFSLLEIRVDQVSVQGMIFLYWCYSLTIEHKTP